jgi:hypothetical protein
MQIAYGGCNRIFGRIGSCIVASEHLPGAAAHFGGTAAACILYDNLYAVFVGSTAVFEIHIKHCFYRIVFCFARSRSYHGIFESNGTVVSVFGDSIYYCAVVFDKKFHIGNHTGTCPVASE